MPRENRCLESRCLERIDARLQGGTGKVSEAAGAR